MIDAIGRTIDHLRISLTNRCNLDCFYCHKEGNAITDIEMDTAQVLHVLAEAKRSGITTIKFTGGEPLLRTDISTLLVESYRLGFSDVGLTTNGTLLAAHIERLRRSGLSRVNIGCDSLTGILPKNIRTVYSGILAAKKADMDVKLNMVVLKGINHGQIQDMIDFCTHHHVNLQLIELIDCGTADYETYYYPLTGVKQHLMREADRFTFRDLQRRIRFTIGDIFVELVQPRKEFCAACSKIRITADGKVRPCLMKQTELIDFQDRHSLEVACRVRDSYGYD
jgi:GTP 3',8-cyclase